MNVRLLPALALSLAFSLACSGGTAPPVETPPPPPRPADGSIGVQECDDYIKKVEDCLGKLPVEAKSAVEGSLKANRDAWAQAATTPQGKSALGAGCKVAYDAFTCPNMGAIGAPAGGPTDGTGATTPPADGAATAAGAAVDPATEAKAETKTEEHTTTTGDRHAPTRDARPPTSMERSRDGSSGTSGGTERTAPQRGGSSGGSSGSSGGGADKPRSR